EAFLAMKEHLELKGMSVGLVRKRWRMMKLVNSDVRRESKHKRLIMAILHQPAGITATLRRMHRYGILGRYLPAFGRITGQMQHDLFHVYTVDEHTLNVLRNLRRFTVPERAHEFPLCSSLIAEFQHQEVLYLAALFHDIAKGRGGDHSSLGAVDARRFCKAHGLPREDADLVAWLVESHLLMSGTAQKCDLSDPAVIEAFASKMGSERRLTALYLLTVADIRGTSPNVWNAWKNKLLEHLFHATRRLLRGDSGATDAELQERQRQACSILGRYAIMQPAFQALWEQLGTNYFLRHDSQEIAWHTRLLLTHINTTKPIVRARLSPGGDGIQVMIYTLDREDLFARICGFFERMRYSIVEAKVHTTSHGYALDSFLVLDESDKSVRYRDLLSYIEYELAQQLESVQAVEEPSQGRISRQLKHFPMQAEVSVAPAEKGSHHVLSIVAGDRPGLLSRIAHTFLQHGVHLQTAKINTLGNRAEDTFTISARGGKRLSEATLKKLRAALSRQL
ncbi:MAG: HD domain-containing protein, partial [Nitrosomonadales bacterium]